MIRFVTFTLRALSAVCALALVPGIAHAAELVLYDGEVSVEFDAAVADLGKPAWEVIPATVEERAADIPPRLIGIEAPRCGAPTTNAELRPFVTTAEGQIDYRQLVQAQAALEQAHARVGCLGEPAEASLVGRVAFLMGVVRSLAGDPTAATAAYREALVWQPDLRWTDEFEPSTRAPFEVAVAARAATGVLVLGPGAEDPAALWVDGHRAVATNGALALPPGRHLVQVLHGENATTLSVDLAAGTPVVLVDPAGMRTADLARAVAASDPGPWARALAALGRGEEHVYVRTGGATWLIEGDHFTKLQSMRPSRHASEPRAKSGLGPALVGGGAVALAGGGALLAWGEFSAVAHEDDAAVFEAIGAGTGSAAGRSEMVTEYYARFNESQAERHTVGLVGAVGGGVGAVALLTGLLIGGPGAQGAAPAVVLGPAPGGFTVAFVAAW